MRPVSQVGWTLRARMSARRKCCSTLGYRASLSGLQAVNGLLKRCAHLHLINKQVVLPAGNEVPFHLCLQGLVIHDVLEVGKVVVDMDDVGIRLIVQKCLG